jgi:hypothetical protein
MSYAIFATGFRFNIRQRYFVIYPDKIEYNKNEKVFDIPKYPVINRFAFVSFQLDRLYFMIAVIYSNTYRVTYSFGQNFVRSTIYLVLSSIY